MSSNTDDSVDYKSKLVKFYNDYHDKAHDSKLSCEKYSARASKYEEELLFLGYPALKYLVEIMTQLSQDKVVNNEEIYVLDAGCGTGLVGEYLKQSASSPHLWVIDGYDGAEGMVEVARKKNVYRRLETCFMIRNKEAIDFVSDQYDLVVACGFFGTGLAYPTALDELLRVTKPMTGRIIFTFGKNQPEEYLDAMKKEIKRLVDEDQWKVMKVDEIDYFGRDRSGLSDSLEDGSKSAQLVKCYVYCCMKC